jgi:glucokinase
MNDVKRFGPEGSGGGMSSAQRVLAHLLTQSEPVSRPEIALACDVSRPTVFAAVERLTELGLVTDVGQRVGLPGRSALLYEVSGQAGTGVGVDIGGSNIRVSLTDVRGLRLA